MPSKPRDPNYKIVRRFKSRSKKKKGETVWHTVTVDRNGPPTLRCSCEGWGFNRKCWHVDRTLEQIVERGYKL